MTDLGESPHWRGINHLALITPDMDATVRFYHGVLGMRLVATLRAGPMRHYFFELGAGNTVAFFEWTGADTFAKPAGAPSSRTMQLDHLSFNLADEEALVALRDRLEAAGSEVTPVVEHGIVRSIYFHDPNGIALEASWWEIDITGRAANYGDRRVFADPDPVPALGELATSGTLAWLPATRLAGADILDPA
jgi:catechol 2,3-dioxygenase-like lactoylglutathione lyase family enzyme